MMTSWFQRNRGRARGASQRIQRLLAATSIISWTPGHNCGHCKGCTIACHTLSTGASKDQCVTNAYSAIETRHSPRLPDRNSLPGLALCGLFPQVVETEALSKLGQSHR